jgi:hypothetical protein
MQEWDGGRRGVLTKDAIGCGKGAGRWACWCVGGGRGLKEAEEGGRRLLEGAINGRDCWLEEGG